jgi:hypothetical protein
LLFFHKQPAQAKGDLGLSEAVNAVVYNGKNNLCLIVKNNFFELQPLTPIPDKETACLSM